MLGRLLGFGRGSGPERYEPWERLVADSGPGVREADEVIAGLVGGAGELSENSTTVALLRPREADPTFEALLSGVERELEDLCGRYDYRQLLFVSRLCSGVPLLRSYDASMPATRVRVQNADRWVLRCANRSLERDYMRVEDDGYSLGHLPESIFRDVVKLHRLADFHQRMVVERMMFNLMRLVSSENGLTGLRLRLGAGGRVGFDFGAAETRALGHLFAYRYRSHNGHLAFWAMDGSGPKDDHVPLALSYVYFEGVEDGPYGGGTLFVPVPFWLDALPEYGKRFRSLFEREDRIGMPPEHLQAVSRGLARLGIETAAADDGKLANWGGYTGTLPIPREALLGGPLEEASRQALARTNPERAADPDLGRSVRRFVELASSSPPAYPEATSDRANARAGSQRGRERAAASARTIGYPYMIHGEADHDLWIVDYLNTLPFFQGLASQLQFSQSKDTTKSGTSDAFARTSVFDAGLAEAAGRVPGIEFAFVRDREEPGLPNAKFYFDGGGANREVDVPLRLGRVLIAVQTWAREVDPRISEGEPRAMKRRWDKAKEKLGSTDRYYTDYLLSHPDGRRRMEDENPRYVLPVLCGPFTEPVASLEPEFWLRHPSARSSDEVEKAVPRILTPEELLGFLGTATEQELREICERHGWKL